MRISKAFSDISEFRVTNELLRGHRHIYGRGLYYCVDTAVVAAAAVADATSAAVAAAVAAVAVDQGCQNGHFCGQIKVINRSLAATVCCGRRPQHF